jgi:hypothetical protein
VTDLPHDDDRIGMDAEPHIDVTDGDHRSERLNPWGRFWKWLHTPTPPPKADATVEVAWLPLWQAQLVLHELWERSIPAVISEDHTSHLRLGAREPMARIFVIGARVALARSVIEEVIGHEPPTL